MPKIRIGVSACLLGARVRFDGGHKRNDFLVETLGKLVEFVPVCPEVELGLGVPRETLHLVRDGPAGATRMVASQTGIDHTGPMNSYAERRVLELGREGLSGYVLKQDSPSCGKERVRVFGSAAMPARDGTGLFAAALMRRYPNLPVEEEGRLSEPQLCANFVERVFAYRRLRSLFSARWTRSALFQFHTAHQLTLMAHSPTSYNELGRFVANANGLTRVEISGRYEREFMQALKRPATTTRHTNVLHHMLGYLRPHLARASRDELLMVIDDYRRGLAPLAAPINLFRHYAQKFEIAYLLEQVYLEPHPNSLQNLLSGTDLTE